ncbi:MAG TPA: type IX secretion system protein PorQ [Paludibacteraceae bacterium]|nr:type IX secretion system protein PorQ [Paludibacteraceae bacterium]
MRYFLISVFSFFSTMVGLCASNESVYKFVTLPNSSAVSALGGTNISLQNQDLNLVFQNPALLSNEMNNDLVFNYMNYISDVNFGSAGYSHNIDSLSAWAIEMTYVNYGSFDGYTKDDVSTGEFSAGDFALSAVYSRMLFDRIRAGITLKPVYSYMDTYNSFGVLVDVGAVYYDKEHDFSTGLTLKNVGVQINGYYSEEDSQHREDMPWDLQLGVTKRLAHAPFRFSLTLVDLSNWDLDYNREKTKSSLSSLATDSDDDDEIGWFDMTMRHILIGVEFIPTKNFYVMASYNHRRNREFSLEDKKSINGFSFGAGLYVYKFNLGFAYSQYAAAGNTLTFSIGTSLDSFK